MTTGTREMRTVRTKVCRCRRREQKTAGYGGAEDEVSSMDKYGDIGGGGGGSGCGSGWRARGAVRRKGRKMMRSDEAEL
ncbi:hypothetical protein MTR_7g093060 [Medicago truncatula]|uniref:Uncharacterized protein n=1 Tax=Medicago truncatula TaxID=3880 RepID=G7KVC4_MEDTR|nr:hypothetical protein MTR_7g093060 [Medicago truncatula]